MPKFRSQRFIGQTVSEDGWSYCLTCSKDRLRDKTVDNTFSQYDTKFLGAASIAAEMWWCEYFGFPFEHHVTGAKGDGGFDLVYHGLLFNVRVAITRPDDNGQDRPRRIYFKDELERCDGALWGTFNPETMVLKSYGGISSKQFYRTSFRGPLPGTNKKCWVDQIKPEWLPMAPWELRDEIPRIVPEHFRGVNGCFSPDLVPKLSEIRC